MSYQYKITRLERIKENNVLKKLVIGVTCTNLDNKQTAYIDWEVNVEDIPDLNKKTLRDYIIKHLTKKEKQTYAEVEAPSILENLQKATQTPVITMEEETLLTEQERDLIIEGEEKQDKGRRK